MINIEELTNIDKERIRLGGLCVFKRKALIRSSQGYTLTDLENVCLNDCKLCNHLSMKDFHRKISKDYLSQFSNSTTDLSYF